MFTVAPKETISNTLEAVVWCVNNYVYPCVEELTLNKIFSCLYCLHTWSLRSMDKKTYKLTLILVILSLCYGSGKQIHYFIINYKK